MLTADPQESVPDAQGHEGVRTLLALPQECPAPVTLYFPGMLHLPWLLEDTQILKTGMMESP